jgi:hypothetical protein
MDKFKDAQIVVNLKFEDNRAIYNLGFPSSKQKLTLQETTHILTGAVAMLIRGVTKEKDGISESELMGEVIEHLNSEFVNTDSFSDAEVKRENAAPKDQQELTINQIEAIKKIEESNIKDLFRKQFEIAKVLGRIGESEIYSNKMSLKEYQKIFKQTTK